MPVSVNSSAPPRGYAPAPAPSRQATPPDNYRPALDQGHASASALALQIAATSAPKPEKRESWFRRHFGRSKKPKVSEQQQLMNQFEDQRKMRSRYVELYSLDSAKALAEAKRCMSQGDREGAALAYARHKDMNRWVQVNKVYLHQIQKQEAELANQEAFEHLRNLQAAGMERIESLRLDNGNTVEHSDWVQGSLETLDADSHRMASNIDALMQSEAAGLAQLEMEMLAESGPRVVLPSVEAPQTNAPAAPQVLPPETN